MEKPKMKPSDWDAPSHNERIDEYFSRVFLDNPVISHQVKKSLTRSRQQSIPTHGKMYSDEQLTTFLHYYLTNAGYAVKQRIENNGPNLLFFEGIRDDDFGNRHEVRGWLHNNSAEAKSENQELFIDIMNDGPILFDERKKLSAQ